MGDYFFKKERIVFDIDERIYEVKINALKKIFGLSTSVSEAIEKETDVTNELFEEIESETPFIRLDYPRKALLKGYWVYFRHEDTKRYVV